jgi:hypothetical protein
MLLVPEPSLMTTTLDAAIPLEPAGPSSSRNPEAALRPLALNVGEKATDVPLDGKALREMFHTGDLGADRRANAARTRSFSAGDRLRDNRTVLLLRT